MSWTQSDVDNLKAAIASWNGARSMTFGDQSIQLMSVDEALKLLAAMQGEVNETSTTTPPRVRYGITRKGC